MSVADHFDHTPDAAFVRAYDKQTARRQFQISLILILVLSFAAFALGLLVRLDAGASESVKPPPTRVDRVQFASSLRNVWL
jgi:hypothetical protein